MKKILVGLAAALSLLPLFAQVSTPSPSPTAPNSASAPAGLSPAAAEIVRLAQSGVGDDVVLAYIKNSQAFFNLSADNVLSLKNAGLSSPVLAAMLQHDSTLRVPPVAAATLPTAAPAQQTQPTQPTMPAQPVMPAQPQIPDTPPAPPRPAKPIVVEQAPPAPQLEIVPLAPSSGYVWIPGYWSWRGGAWVWTGGRWALQPYPTAVWMDGRWARHGRSWIWISGRWR